MQILKKSYVVLRLKLTSIGVVWACDGAGGLSEGRHLNWYQVRAGSGWTMMESKKTIGFSVAIDGRSPRGEAAVAMAKSGQYSSECCTTDIRPLHYNCFKGMTFIFELVSASTISIIFHIFV